MRLVGSHSHHFTGREVRGSRTYAIVFTAALALVGGYFVVLTPGEAQEQPPPPPPQPPNLFTPVDIPGWQDPALPGDTAILRSRPVTVNFDVLTPFPLE